MNLERAFTAGAFVLVGAALVLGFLFVGTPWHARQLAMDRKRVENLHAIAMRMYERFERRPDLPQRLPASIKATDPSTSRPYEYAKLDRRHYRLCGSFATAASEDDDRPPGVWDGDWSHPAGRVCFEFDVTAADGSPLNHSPR